MSLWLLGLAVALMAVGGISIDLWRVATERRVLAAAVDAAAAAGANAIDVTALRGGDDLRIDPVAAEKAAGAVMASMAPRTMTAHTASATPTAVRVVADGDIPITLLRVFVPDLAPISVRVESVAAPRASG